jgi:TolB protein
VKRVVVIAVSFLILAAVAGATTPLSEGKLVFTTNGDGITDRLEIGVANPDGSGFKKLTHHSITGGGAVWTSDGRALVFGVDDSFTGRFAYWRMRPNGTGFLHLPAEDGDRVSPSGRLIARFTAYGIELVNTRGKRVRRVPLRLGRDDGYDAAPLWSPDGRWLALTIGTETDSSEYERVLVVALRRHTPPHFLSKRVPSRFESADAWSPDGKRLATTVTVGESTHDALFVVGREGRVRVRLSRDVSGATGESWAPDSRRLAYVQRRGGIYIVGADGRGRHLVAASKGLHMAVGAYLPVAWSPRRELLAFGDRDGLWLVRSDGKGRRRLTRRGAGSEVSWSPNGRRLVFGDAERIFVTDTSGRSLHAITASRVWDDAPAWSRDATRIAFIRGPAGFRDPDQISVVTMDAKGRSSVRLGTGYDPHWSPDGSRVAFVQVAHLDPADTGRLGRGRILVVPGAGGTPKQVAVGTAPTWSPDGTRIAFMRYGFGAEERSGEIVHFADRSTLLIAAADGSGEREVASRVSSNDEPLYYRPQWSPDGSRIAVFTGGTSDQPESIRLVDPATGVAQTLDTGDLIPDAVVVWSPDATRLAYLAGGGAAIGTIRADGTNPRLILTSQNTSKLFYREPAWSSDSTRLAFPRCADADDDTRKCDIYTALADGTAQQRVTRTIGLEGSVAWSASP